VQGTLTFPPGKTSLPILLPVVHDFRAGSDRTVVLNLSSPANATLGTNATHTYTIQETDPAAAATFALATAAVAEGQPAVVQVKLSRLSDDPVTVSYAVTGGTGQAGVNYVAPSGTLTFAPGQVQRTFTLATLLDGVVGTNPTVQLSLTAAQGGV